MKNLLMGLMLLLSVALIVSCGKDDEMDSQSCSDGIQNGTETGIDCGGTCTACITTVEEDKANVKQTFDNLVTCAEEIRDARSFTELFRNFLDMSDGYVLNEDWIDDALAELENVFDFEDLDNSMRFNLTHHAGTYVYDAPLGGIWTKTADVSDKVVLKFPSTSSSTLNNVELVLDTYTDKLVTIDGENVSLPKTAHAYMNIDGTKAFEFTLAKVTYADNTGYQLPVEIDATLFMDPMTLSVEVSRLTTTSYEMGMSFENGSLCDMGINAQVELKDDDLENFDEDSFKEAAIQVNLGQLSFRTMGDLASLIAIEDPTEAQVNDLVDLDLFFQDIKIADLEINDAMETILIFYKDDTTEDLNDFLSDIEALLEEFFG